MWDSVRVLILESQAEFEISDCTKLAAAFRCARKRGLSEDAVEQIAYQNTARVIRDGMR